METSRSSERWTSDLVERCCGSILRETKLGEDSALVTWSPRSGLLQHDLANSVGTSGPGSETVGMGFKSCVQPEESAQSILPTRRVSRNHHTMPRRFRLLIALSTHHSVFNERGSRAIQLHYFKRTRTCLLHKIETHFFRTRATSTHRGSAIPCDRSDRSNEGL